MSVSTRSDIRLLVVDNHEAVRRDVREAISGTTDIHLVAEAASGSEALGAAELHSVDVILLDIRLPDMSGIELARRLKSRFPDVSIVAFSAFDDADYSTAAMSAGATILVPKSCGVERLVGEIRNAYGPCSQEQ
jgi:DNA-binding NarL/FixJ family response regulator